MATVEFDHNGRNTGRKPAANGLVGRILEAIAEAHRIRTAIYARGFALR